MSIFSESDGESRALEYEEILLAVVDEARFESYDDLHPKKLAWFAKKHIYPRYVSALNDAWRNEPTANQEKIQNFFKNY